MKPKGLLTAVALLAMLGGAVWWSNKRQASAGKSSDKTVKLLTIPEDQFQEIRIKKVTGEVIDLQKQDGKWKITEPTQLPADQDAVSSMVTNLASLNADTTVDDKAADLKPFGLNDPTLDIQVKLKNGKTEGVLIGDDTPTGSGAYAKLPGSPKVVTIASFVKSSSRQAARRSARQAAADLRPGQADSRGFAGQRASHRVRQGRAERMADREATAAAGRQLRGIGPGGQAARCQDGPLERRRPR